MPCPFTGPKMFCADPNFLSQPKNLTAFSASSKTFVLAQTPILLNANHLFVWHKILRLPQYVNKSLVWHKKFGPAQNILGPVKGQGISLSQDYKPFHFLFGVRILITHMYCKKNAKSLACMQNF